MKIAIYYASHLSELGEDSVCYQFFQKIIKNPLINRLYKKYVKREDVHLTIETISKIKKDLSSRENELISKLISDMKYGSEFSEWCLKEFGKYVPIRLIPFDEPYHTISLDIPLEDYDNNEGEPFWMRPEYIIEKYGKNTQVQINTITPTSYEHKATYKDGKLVEDKKE